MFRTLKGMLGFLGLKYINSQWVVQKYIEKPLLYNNRKFDIRVWVLITNKNEVFFYKHGYMRTSSSSYDTKDQNNYVHLTNNCLQKHGNSYGAFEEGNTLSFKVLQDYLRQQYPDLKIDLETHIIARFKDFIIDSFLAWKNDLNPSRRKNLFELFGYDFLIDEDLRVWLIEVYQPPFHHYCTDNSTFRSIQTHTLESLTPLSQIYCQKWSVICWKSPSTRYSLQKSLREKTDALTTSN